MRARKVRKGSVYLGEGCLDIEERECGKSYTHTKASASNSSVSCAVHFCVGRLWRNMMMPWKSIFRSSSSHRLRKEEQTYRWKSEKASGPSAWQSKIQKSLRWKAEIKTARILQGALTRYVSHIRTILRTLSSLISKQFIQRKANWMYSTPCSSRWECKGAEKDGKGKGWLE